MSGSRLPISKSKSEPNLNDRSIVTKPMGLYDLLPENKKIVTTPENNFPDNLSDESENVGKRSFRGDLPPISPSATLEVQSPLFGSGNSNDSENSPNDSKEFAFTDGYGPPSPIISPSDFKTSSSHTTDTNTKRIARESKIPLILDLNNDGIPYTKDQEACFKIYKGEERTGAQLLKLFTDQIDYYKYYMSLGSYNGTKKVAPEAQKLYDSMLSTQKALHNPNLSEEINQKKYKMAITLALRFFDDKTPENAEALQNYAEVKRPYLKYALVAALVALAAAAFTFATLLTLGVAPVVTVAATLGVKAVLGWSIGSAAVGGLLVTGLYTLFHKPKPSVAAADKEMHELGGAAVNFSLKNRK